MASPIAWFQGTPILFRSIGRRSGMGFNRRRMEADRKAKVATEAATGRATDAQVLDDAEALIATMPAQCTVCRAGAFVP
jgi:hypothetical protein